MATVSVEALDFGGLPMKSSRENVETLVARIEQLERDRDAAAKALSQSEQERQSLAAQLAEAKARIAENAQIAARQAATISKLRRKLEELAS
jgi:chromosome segregation ATPase